MSSLTVKQLWVKQLWIKQLWIKRLWIKRLWIKRLWIKRLWIKRLWIKRRCGIASSLLFLIVMFTVCFSSGCDRTYCFTGESRCTEDLSAIEVCDRGEWVIEELCEEGLMCMRDASSGDDHAHGHRDSLSLSCVDHQNDESDEHSMGEDVHHTGEHSHALTSWESYHDEHDKAMSRAAEE